ncbi:MAG: ATP synthase F1 subunit epsilon [Clostridia bacterium]|nr:ATP synthase F1 subunit epsilon [Clostridia bacterium]
MAVYHLQIVTPDRMVFDGQAERLIVRTVNGDVCILARHIDYAAPLGIGVAHVTDETGTTRAAACSGGLLSVSGGEVRLIATTFEWADEIDLERAAQAQKAAEQMLKELDREDAQYTLTEARLKRALIRQQAKQ